MKVLKDWNLFEKFWLVSFTVIALGITIATRDTFFSFLVLLSGILCVVLAAKGNIYTYAFGMVNTICYANLAFNNQLYGEMGLNLFFFMPMNVVGYLMWQTRMRDTTVIMRGLSIIWKLITVAACILCISILGYLLGLIEGQKTPYLDATTNILSIIATILMVMRYKEQWLLYIVLNIVTIVMWSFRLAAGSDSALMMIIMWSAFLINAFYGYYNWHIGAKSNQTTPDSA